MKTLEKKIWTQKDYQSYLENLKSLENLKYSEFHKKLTITKYQILGIPVPKSRKIAKEISKTDVVSFLKFPKDTYYEEVLIEGFVIASILEEKLFFEQLEKFFPKIDNWAICDGFCNSLKIVAKNSEKYFDYFLNLLNKKEPFTIRVGLITLLSYYIKQEYIQTIFQNLDQISSEHYYVNMGMAWLLAEIYIHFPDETEKYLKVAKINDFTMNKTISKIRDSYRVTKEKKEDLLQYKRKGKK